MDNFDLKKYLAEGRLLNENQKINTNVYYVDEYQDFYHEAVPEYEIDDVEAMLRSNEKNHLYIKKGTKGQYEDGIFTTEKESDTRVSPEYIGEGEVLKEGLFDRRKVINWLKSNHKYDMTNDPNADYDYELGDPDDGDRVRVEKDGIFVNIECGISDKISFGEFRRQYIGEGEVLKENRGRDIGTLEELKSFLYSKQSQIVSWVQKAIDDQGEENISEEDIKQWIADDAGEITPGRFNLTSDDFNNRGYDEYMFEDVYEEFVKSTYDKFFSKELNEKSY